MANEVITLKRREKLAKASAGDILLPKISFMAFGDGGLDESGTPIVPLETETSLKSELLRKPISYTYPVPTSCRYSCSISENELAGFTINEIALIDSDGDLVAIKTFGNKYKDSDMEMIFEIHDKF